MITAIVGATLGAWFTVFLTERRDQARRAEDRERQLREVKGAARLVWWELEKVAVHASAAVQRGDIEALSASSQVAWAAHGAVLAAELPSDGFELIADAMSRSAEIGELLRSGKTDAAKERAASLMRMARKGQSLIANYAFNGDPHAAQA